MILVCYLDDTVDLLTQPFHHPRIDGGPQPFVLWHGLAMSIFLDRVSARIQVFNPRKTTMKKNFEFMLVILLGEDR